MRRLFTILAAVSLVLCLASCVLWVRSYWGTDYLERRWLTKADAVLIEHQSQEIHWSHGEIRFILATDAYFNLGQINWKTASEDAGPHWGYGRLGEGHEGWASPAPRTLLNRLGWAQWGTGSVSSFSESRSRVWSAPAWGLVIVFGALPVLWIRDARRRRRRDRAGLCRGCGYDLRATPDRCPECGAVSGVS